jgi:peptidoglycan/xylan/chitin deacetylase (PgdA/CDA1 family)
MIVSRKSRLTVVTLHRVGPSFAIQPFHVEQCFRLLVHYFHVVKPSCLDLTTRERRTAVVVVDDGHADAYRYIFPIAKATGVPITLCIPTDFFFRGKWLWFDKFDWATHHAARGKVAQIRGFEVHTDHPMSFTALRMHLKRCPPAERDAAIAQLICALEVAPPLPPPEEYRSVSKCELREMLDSGLVEIGGHTVTHTIATVLGEADFGAECGQSKCEWESFCGQPILSFCYPNGESGDFDARTALTLRKAGYRYAFTSLEGTNLIRTMDPLEMKRVHTHRTPGVWAKLASGLADVQDSFRRP